jgi:predicted RecA/RadA family phage recombinase
MIRFCFAVALEKIDQFDLISLIIEDGVVLARKARLDDIEEGLNEASSDRALRINSTGSQTIEPFL